VNLSTLAHDRVNVYDIHPTATATPNTDLRFPTNIHVSRYYTAVWRSGSVVRRVNEVALRWVRLVLGWVTVFGRVYHLGI